MNTRTLVRTRTWTGLVLVLATGLIHGVEGPTNYHEAAYKGILFFLNAAGTLVAARGIYRGEKLWGWTLGVLISAGALVLYIVSHTIGLPGWRSTMNGSSRSAWRRCSSRGSMSWCMPR